MSNLYVMCGLPGSGKSYYSNLLSKEENCIVISSDNIRNELFGSEYKYNPNDNAKIFKVVDERIIKSLTNNKNCILDACNISYKRRKTLLERMRKYYDKAICIFVYTPYEKCFENNSKRSGSACVPDFVIEKMYRTFNVPYYYEKWDEIRVISKENEWKGKIDPVLYSNEYENYNQDSKYHSESLGAHLKEAFKNVETEDLIVKNAALIHDNGKPFTKTFENKKGIITSEAHYYGHEIVGSYNSFEFVTIGKEVTTDDKLHIAALIRWHMQPYFWEKESDEKKSEKQRNKYKKLWGDKLYEEIMMIHDADIKAHH